MRKVTMSYNLYIQMKQPLITNFFTQKNGTLTNSFKRIKISSVFVESDIPGPIPFTVKFKHLDVESVYFPTKDRYGLYAYDDLEVGTLILVEDGIIGTEKIVQEKIIKLPDIYKELYPRNTIDATHLGSIALKKQTREKVWYNSFEWYDYGDSKEIREFQTILPFLSRCNHSCKPNIDIVRYLYSDYSQNNLSRTKNIWHGGFAVYITKKVHAGDELFISYGTDTGHSSDSHFDWTCECGLSKEDREDLYTVSNKMAYEFWTEDKEYVFDEYLL